VIAAGFIAGAVVLGLIACLFIVLASDLRDAERRCADARVDAQKQAGQLAIAVANEATQRARADAERKRADALDDLLAQAATAGPVAGSLQRLLQAWRSTRAGPDTAGDAGAGSMSPTSAAQPTG